MTSHRHAVVGSRRSRFPAARFRWLLIVVAIATVLANCGDDDGGGGGEGPGPTPASVLADLVITSATVERVDPQSCFGHEICLIVTVANVGTADATGITDGCGTSSFGDPEPWGQYVADGSVPAGASVTLRGDYHVLGPHLPATFDLYCEVDAADRVPESDESNNAYAVTLSL